eukprot:TCONS_00019778-protein
MQKNKKTDRPSKTSTNKLTNGAAAKIKPKDGAYKGKTFGTGKQGAKIARDFDERDITARRSAPSSTKSSRKHSKASSITSETPLTRSQRKSSNTSLNDISPPERPSSTKASQLRGVVRKLSSQSDEPRLGSTPSSLAASRESIIEEWERFESLEKKQEIQALKNHIAEIKKESDRTTELLINKKNQYEESKSESSAKDEQIQLLQKQINELNQVIETLRAEKDEPKEKVFISKETDLDVGVEPQHEILAKNESLVYRVLVKESTSKGTDTVDLQNINIECVNHKVSMEFVSRETDTFDLNEAVLVQEQFGKLEEEVLVTRDEINEVCGQVCAEEDLKILQKEYDQLSSKHKDTTDRYEKQIELSNTLEGENKDLANDLRTTRQHLEDMTSKLNNVQQLVNVKNKEIFELSSSVNLLQKELDSTKDLAAEQQANVRNNNLTEFEKLQNKMSLVEDELMQSRQQKELCEDKIEQLMNENELLKYEKISLEKVTEEVSLQSAYNPLEPSMGEKSDSDLELGLLRQQLEEQHLEMTSLETNLKSDVSELRQNAENQEQLIAKLEHENQKLYKEKYELNENILVLQDRINTISKEHENLLSNENEHRTSIEEDLNDSMSFSEHDSKIEQLLSIHKNEMDMLQEKLNETEKDHESALREKDDLISCKEQQILSLQIDLDEKSRDLKSLNTECSRLRALKDKEQATSDEQESYLLQEIEHVQHECKQKLHTMEEDKDRLTALLQKQYDEKLIEMEVEFEQNKSIEIENVREDLQNEIDSLLAQRTELMSVLSKMESLLIARTPTSTTSSSGRNGFHFDFPDNGKLERKSKVEHSNDDMLLMISNLETQMNGTDLNKTWPLLENHTSSNRKAPLSPNGVKAQFERARSDISLQLRELDDIMMSDSRLPSLSASETRSHASEPRIGSSLNASFDELSFDHDDSISASSPLTKQTPLHSPTTTHTPSPSFRDSGISTIELSNRNTFYEKQLRDLLRSFLRFELQCHLIATDFSNEKWFLDLQKWKDRANKRLKRLEQRYLKYDNTLSKSITYRPTDEEVREIIADVNKKYDRFKQHEI